MSEGWATRMISVRVGSETVSVCAGERPGAGTPVLYLHGLGSTMDDFAGSLTHPAFAGRQLLALDFPGCGRSSYARGSSLCVDDLVDVTHAVVRALVGRKRVALVGHSMGGYVGLRYATSAPPRVECFVSVEGNLAPGDCAVLSRDGAADRRVAVPGTEK